MYTLYTNYLLSQDVKLHIFQQIHTPSGNQLTSSYFCSVISYATQTSFIALIDNGIWLIWRSLQDAPNHQIKITAN